MLDWIHWLGHASFRINGPPSKQKPIIYIDPWRLPEGSPRADLILISHDHHDHCSPEDVEAIRKKKTLIIGNDRVAERLGCPVRVLRTWQGAVSPCGGASVRAVPAYTLHHAYHDKRYGGLGFIISVNRNDIYYAGDTDLIPEMDKLGCDIALLPVGGGYTMGVAEAAAAAHLLRPRFAIPMHYGREVPGSRDHGARFVQSVNSGVVGVELPVENDRVYA